MSKDMRLRNVWARIAGRTVQNVRLATTEETKDAWGREFNGSVHVIVLDNGDKLYACRDPENNGPGAFLFLPGDNTTAFMF